MANKIMPAAVCDEAVARARSANVGVDLAYDTMKAADDHPSADGTGIGKTADFGPAVNRFHAAYDEFARTKRQLAALCPSRAKEVAWWMAPRPAVPTPNEVDWGDRLTLEHPLTPPMSQATSGALRNFMLHMRH